MPPRSIRKKKFFKENECPVCGSPAIKDYYKEQSIYRMANGLMGIRLPSMCMDCGWDGYKIDILRFERYEDK
jgi:hypothetical protein